MSSMMLCCVTGWGVCDIWKDQSACTFILYLHSRRSECRHYEDLHCGNCNQHQK